MEPTRIQNPRELVVGDKVLVVEQPNQICYGKAGDIGTITCLSTTKQAASVRFENGKEFVFYTEDWESDHIPKYCELKLVLPDKNPSLTDGAKFLKELTEKLERLEKLEELLTFMKWYEHGWILEKSICSDDTKLANTVASGKSLLEILKEVGYVS